MRAEAIQITRIAPCFHESGQLTNHQDMETVRYASDFISTLELRWVL